MKISETLLEAVKNTFLGERIPIDLVDVTSEEKPVLVKDSNRLTETNCRKIAKHIHEIGTTQYPYTPIDRAILRIREKFPKTP